MARRVLLFKWQLLSEEQVAQNHFKTFKLLRVVSSASPLVDYMQLTLVNMLLFLDLFLAMINPFYPRIQRTKYYAFVLLFFTLYVLFDAY